jgi:hypothetical protein
VYGPAVAGSREVLPMFNNWRIGRPFGIDVFISG